MLTTININYKYGTRQKVLKKNKRKYDGTCKCQSCELPIFNTIKFEYHHKLLVQFGAKTDDKNLILLCVTCHKEITNAVAMRSREKCNNYILQGTLVIPENIFIKEFN